MIQPIGFRETLTFGGVRWQLYCNVAADLFDANGLKLEQWRASGQAVVVKSGSGRTIYLVRLPGASVYIKHFQARTFGSFVHYSVCEGRASRECRHARVVLRSGVNTIQPLALGERRRNGMLYESFLITEAIQDGTTLFEIIEGAAASPAGMAPRLRQHIAVELARMVAKIHSQGLEHRDLHERNIVVRPRGEEMDFFLLDLHELRVHRELPWGRALRELTRMGRYFTMRTGRADRLRFIREYCRRRDIPLEQVRTLARTVERATDESRAEFWRRRDTRKIHRNARIHEYRGSGVRAFASQEVPEDFVRKLMADPDRPFETAVLRWWKQGRVTRVAEVSLPEIRSDNALIYKQHYFKGWHESFAALLHPNQANRAWNNGIALLLRELPTPKPLVLIEKLIGGMAVTSYLVTERVPQGKPISQFLDESMPGLSPPERRAMLRGLMRQSANLLRLMHDRRVTHNDLKASNILVRPGPAIDRPELWLIDLDSVQTWQTVPLQRRLQNLTRFYVSFHHSKWLTRTDRLRFLRLYFRSEFRDRAHWHAAWRTIQAGAFQKIERNLRQGRSVL